MLVYGPVGFDLHIVPALAFRRVTALLSGYSQLLSQQPTQLEVWVEGHPSLSLEGRGDHCAMASLPPGQSLGTPTASQAGAAGMASVGSPQRGKRRFFSFHHPFFIPISLEFLSADGLVKLNWSTDKILI